MLQRYKLRLGDGTVLFVDHDGLGPWLDDRDAKVQAEGSRQWRPLREFLARERAAARREVRRRASVHESPFPRRPSRPRDDSGLPPPREDGLPLIPPPPKKEAHSTTPAPTPREDGLPLIPPPPKHEARPQTPAPTPREDGLPLIPPPPKHEARPQTPAPPPREDGLPLIPPPPPAAAIGERDGEEESSGDAPVVVPDESVAPALVLPVAEDEIAPPSLEGVGSAEVTSAVEEDDGFSFDPATLLASMSAPEVAPGPGPAAPAAETDPSPTVIVGAPRTVRVEVETAMIVEPTALDEALPSGPTIGAPPGIQAFADNPEVDEPGRASAVIDDAPAIPWKPPEHEPAARPRPSPRPERDRRAPSHSATTVSEAPPWLAHPWVAALLRGAASLGAVLGRSVEPINRLEHGLPPLVIEEGALSRARTRARALLAGSLHRLSRLPASVRQLRRAARSAVESRWASPTPPEPVLRAAPVAHDPEPVPPAVESPWANPTPNQHVLRPVVAPVARDPEPARPAVESPWAYPTPPAHLLSPIVVPVAHHPEPPPPAVGSPWASPTPSQRISRPAVVPVAHDPEPPPPAIEALPVVPLATPHEVAPGEDVYEGPGIGRLLAGLWRWTQWLVLLGALVGAASLAALHWRTWFPPTAEVGDRAFREIDRQAHAAERAAQRRAVVEEAARRLPYLAPETIEEILSRSPTGLLGVPEIFEAACDAADWGSWALTPSEAAELRDLRGRLLQELGPTDRERVREYDRARANGLVFPLDNRLGTLMWARGTRELPPPDQQRLRELLGKAISAGLTSAGSSRTTPDR